jgi:lysine 2,3-aminomutase
MKKYSKTIYNTIPLFQNISEGDWKDWKWQLRNAIRDISTLKKIIELDEKDEKELEKCLHKFDMSITPYYAALMDKKYKRCPVRLQC